MWQPFPLIKSLMLCNVSYFPVDCLLHSSSLVVIFVHQFFFLSEMSVIRLWCRKSLREYLKIKSKSVIPFEKSGGFLFYSINHPPLTYPPPPPPPSSLYLPTPTFPGFPVHFDLSRGLVKSYFSTPCWKCTDACIDVVLHVFLLQHCAWKAAKFLERWEFFLNSI